MSYVAYARQLLATGTFASGYNRLYAGYCVFISLFLLLKLNTWAICIVQVLMSGLATIALYHTILRLIVKDWIPAAFVTLVFIIWIDAQQFNSFVLTESLFTSFLIFCSWAIARAQSGQDIVLALLLMICTATLRPNGFIALSGAGLASCWLLWQRGKRFFSLLCLLLWLGLSGLLLNYIVEPFFLIPSYAVGDVLFHYPPTNVRPPDDLVMPNPGSLPFIKLIWFVLHNIAYFSKLCLLKALYFLGWPRPWYSFLHKVWIVLVLLPLYIIAIESFIRREVISPMQIYLVATILLQLGIIMLTTEDQNARFSAPLIAYWLQLAALGFKPQIWLSRRATRVVQ